MDGNPPDWAIGTKSYLFMYSSGDPEPSRELLNAVHRGDWTVGGMAEAGWAIAGTLENGAPIFMRATRRAAVSASDMVVLGNPPSWKAPSRPENPT